MVNKLIWAYTLLQARKNYLQNVCKSKRGQAVLEYAIVFFIAGLGMAVSVSSLQTKLEMSLVNQMDILRQAGQRLF